MGRSADVLLHRYSARYLFLRNGTPDAHAMTQAKNIVNYLRIIHRILAPGGVWINLGTSSMSSTFHVPLIYTSSPNLMQARSFGTLRKTLRTTPQLSST
jgi:N2227-like protein